MDLKTASIQMQKLHMVVEQTKLQMERQKDLRSVLDSKVREIVESEKRVKDVYNKIQVEYKSFLDGLNKDLENLEKSNQDVKTRLFLLEKGAEKEKTIKKFNSDGGNQTNGGNHGFLVDSDCLNRNSCSVCLEDPKCVWCSISKNCVRGTSAGPLDGSCKNSFQYSYCS